MLAPDRWAEAATTVARTFGLRGAALRALHEARRSAGLYRAAPRAWSPSPGAPHARHAFSVDADAVRAATDVDVALARAERVAEGEHHAYRAHWRRLPEAAEDWDRHPVTGHRFASAEQWWRVRHLDARAGDVKDVWEPARFGWAYDLVRGEMIGRDGRYAAAFDRHFAQWRGANAPFAGVHWSCGQETAIRAVALLYAEANLGPRDRLASVLAASGERIHDAIGYAISQRNNHAISEATGLIALGVRFRDELPAARRWLSEGRRLLPRLIGEQFAEDGWYAQHSFTYMRLALDQCVVAERALRAVGETLPPASVERLRGAAHLLLAVVDPESGHVPNHGANDGAFVHPITTAAYRDFRPALTAVCATWDVALPSNVRPCRETLAWLGLQPPRAATPLGDGLTRGASGWAAVRLGRTQVFLRAGEYSSRPSHLDPLHVDVRVDGREIVVDPGTYSYNAPAPWRNGLVSARVHNGPVLDGREPGLRGPRFLWYAWPSAAIERADYDGREAVLVARTPEGVRRTVRVTTAIVEVRDVVPAGAASEVAVTWLLHPDAPADAICVEGGGELHSATEADVTGWYAPTYGERTASRYLSARRDARSGATITTLIGPNASS